MVHRTTHREMREYLQDKFLLFHQFTPPRKAGPYKILHYYYDYHMQKDGFDQHVSNFVLLVRKHEYINNS